MAGMATSTFDSNASEAALRIREVHASGGGLCVLTGAGMSVTSGVPVFRNSDGTMSADFLRFLGGYNTARRAAGLDEAADWFDFSVPEMFNKPTEKEAWDYWRWRILRAAVPPAADYAQLMQLVECFGDERAFVSTSNCDMLHVRAGLQPQCLHEIHGSLRFVQCADHCCSELHDVDDAFVARLRSEPAWVPRCPRCPSCLRPNVMIFGDNKLVPDQINQQEERFAAFCERFEGNWAVLEIGAGTVISSIRELAATCSKSSQCFVRINPSAAECEARSLVEKTGAYLPLQAYCHRALSALTQGFFKNSFGACALTQRFLGSSGSPKPAGGPSAPPGGSRAALAAKLDALRDTDDSSEEGAEGANAAVGEAAVGAARMADGCSLAPQVVEFVIAESWSYNMLNLRRLADFDSDVVHVVRVAEPRPARTERCSIYVDVANSTRDWWKLAADMGGRLGVPWARLAADTAAEGWVCKLYFGEPTLELRTPA